MSKHESRKICRDADLKHLPVGAVVVNGSKLGEEWVFRKIPTGTWKLYDIPEENFAPHRDFVQRHPSPYEWSAKGFISLNLPVYVLSRKGEREESLRELKAWHQHKLDWMSE